MSDDDFCIICRKTGQTFDNRICPFCNGTGEPNNIAEEYMRNHICQCIVLDREFCPVCEKKCHHDSSLTPKQKIDPGGDGSPFTKSYKVNTETSPTDEGFIII